MKLEKYLLIFCGATVFSVCNAQENSLQSLYETGKVWGFVKYNAATNNDLDELLFSVLDKRLSLDSFIALTCTDEEKKKPSNNNGTNCVNEDWIKVLNGVDSLSKKQLCRQKWNSNNNQYLSAKKSNGHTLLKEKSYQDSVSKNEMLLGVFRMWNYLNYFYPHRCAITDWDTILYQSINILNKEYSRKNYETALLTIANHLYDGHTSIYYTRPTLKGLVLQTVSNVLPCTIRTENGLVIVQSSFDTLLQKNDVLLSMQNRTVADFIEKWNAEDTIHIQQKVVAVPFDTTVLELNRNGEIFRLKLSRELIKKWDWIRYASSPEKITPLHQNYGMIDLNNIQSKQDVENAQKIFDSHDTLVVNLSGYPQSFYVNQFAQMLYPSHILYLIKPNTGQAGSFQYVPIKEKGQYAGGKKNICVYQQFYAKLGGNARAGLPAKQRCNVYRLQFCERHRQRIFGVAASRKY